MAVGGTTSNIIQALKSVIAPGARTTMREVITTLMPGAQSFVDPVITFFEKLKELHMAGAKPTDENTLDNREFADEVNRLRKTFRLSLNPFHYILAFFKFLFGMGSSTDTKVAELKRFGGLANMPYGPTTYAVEACESLIKIIHDRISSKQNFLSRVFFPDKLAKDPIVNAAEEAIKSWLPRVAHLDQLRHLANKLFYGTASFISENLGRFSQQLLQTAESGIQAAQQRAQGPARANVPAAMHAAYSPLSIQSVARHSIHPVAFNSIHSIASKYSLV